MAASAQLLIDIDAVLTNGPNAATVAKAIAAGGPIMDYTGNLQLVKLKLQEANVLLGLVKSATDGSDPNLTNINKALATLNHTGGPSTAVVTDLETVYATAPTSVTSTKSISAAGPIMDVVGNVSLVILKLKEVKQLLGSAYAKGLIAVTDSTDATNLGLLQDMLTALA